MRWRDEARIPLKTRHDAKISTANSRLPEDLAKFLSRDTFSLSIKGESGTGKTILALSVLEALSPIQNLLYISTRTSPSQLFENYPWIEGMFGPARRQHPHPGRDSIAWDTLVDARLDEPRTVFERITNVLMDKSAPTVVIDEWESLSEGLGNEALRSNMKVLETWRERAGARFFFVGGSSDGADVDSMSQGSVMLTSRVVDGRRLREIVIAKLQGVRISRPSHFFTLSGGAFSSFPRYAIDDYSILRPRPAMPANPVRPVKGRVQTGYEALDTFLEGGFPAPSTVVLELDDEVDSRVVLTFLSTMVQDCLASGGSLDLGDPLDVDRKYMRDYIKTFASGSKTTPRLLTTRKAKPAGSDKPSPRHRLKRVTKGVGLRVIWSPRGDGGTRTRVSGFDPNIEEGLTVLVAKGAEIGSFGLQRAANRLKIGTVEGTLFVRSELPFTAMLALVPAREEGRPTLTLEPMV